jgi:hypothetical protein
MVSSTIAAASLFPAHKAKKFCSPALTNRVSPGDYIMDVALTSKQRAVISITRRAAKGELGGRREKKTQAGCEVLRIAAV